jgi:hypothetical protein
VAATLVSVLLVTSLFVGVGTGATTGVSVSDCLVVSEPGVYTLSGDVEAQAGDERCIRIESSDVVLDGAGHALVAGGATNEVGISVPGDGTVSNLTVTDLTVRGFAEFGVAAPYVENLHISNVVVTRITDGPGMLVGGRDIVIEDVVSRLTQGDGLLVLDSSSVTVQRSIFQNTNGSGVQAVNVTDLSVRENALDFNLLAGLVVSSGDGGATDVVIAGNALTHNGGVGVLLGGVANATFARNVVVSNRGTGVEVARGNDLTLAGNNVSWNFGMGIHIRADYLGDASDVVLTRNHLEWNGQANDVLAGGRLPVDGDGLRLAGVRDVVSTGNEYRYNLGDGVHLTNVMNATFTRELLWLNADDGVDVRTGSNVVVERSRIELSGDSVRSGSGLAVTDDASAPSTAVLRESVVARNTEFGVGYVSASEPTRVVDARGNYWGAANGPGSPDGSGAPLRDPVTGALADGDGDTVSPRPESNDVSSVRFDPFLSAEPEAAPDPPGVRYYQVDLVVGMALPTVGPTEDGGFYGDEGRLVAFLHGNTRDGLQRTGSAVLAPEYEDCLSNVSLDLDASTLGLSVARFTVAEGCTLRMTLAIYEKPGPEFSRDVVQYRFDSETRYFGPGERTLVVRLIE